MNRTRVIIIDDERASREEVKKALEIFSDFEVIGEARNADEAREEIVEKHPDLIFLDIQMPEKSGFELLESLDEVPDVIFTTAFNQYAVRAFDLSALDYLMKPIREERFARAIEKARERLDQRKNPRNRLVPDKQIFIKDGEKCHFIWLSDIYLIESLDNYSRLSFNNQKVYLKRSLNQWEEMLGQALFFRINRTEIINTTYIQEVQTLPKGRLQIRMKTGELLNVSSRQSVKFKSRNNVQSAGS